VLNIDECLRVANKSAEPEVLKDYSFSSTYSLTFVLTGTIFDSLTPVLATHHPDFPFLALLDLLTTKLCVVSWYDGISSYGSLIWRNTSRHVDSATDIDNTT
jgi:hypothetical protein